MCRILFVVRVVTRRAILSVTPHAALSREPVAVIGFGPLPVLILLFLAVSVSKSHYYSLQNGRLHVLSDNDR